MKKIFTLLLMMAVPVLCLAQYLRNVVIYDLTSTDCGSCRCMDSLLTGFILPQFSKTIVIALHGIGSHFKTYYGSNIYNYFRSDYEPCGFMDGLGYGIPSTLVLDSVTSRYNTFSQAPVSIRISSKTWYPAGMYFVVLSGPAERIQSKFIRL